MDKFDSIISATLRTENYSMLHQQLISDVIDLTFEPDVGHRIMLSWRLLLPILDEVTVTWLLLLPLKVRMSLTWFFLSIESGKPLVLLLRALLLILWPTSPRKP